MALTPEQQAAWTRQFGSPFVEDKGRFTNYGEGVTGYEGGRYLTNSQYGPHIADERLGNYIFDGSQWVQTPEASGSLFGDFIKPIALFGSLMAGGGALAGMGEGAAAGAGLWGGSAGAGAAGAAGAGEFGMSTMLGLDAATGAGGAMWGAGAAGAAGSNAMSGVDWLDALNDPFTNGTSALSGPSNALLDSGSVGSAFSSNPGLWEQFTSALSSGGSAATNTLKSLFGGDGSSGGTDWMKLLGSLGASGLGAYASGKQTDALDEMAQRYEGYGAPYRQKLANLYNDPTSFLSSKEVTVPVDQGTSALMRSLSTQGNPFGSGNALQQGQSYASDQLFGKLGQEKDRLAGFGGLAKYNAAAPTAATNAIGASAGPYRAAGDAMGNIFNPPQTQAQTMAEFFKMMGK